MNKQFKTGVFIGRFQPVHNGHIKVITTMLEECEQIVVLIGSDNKPRSIKNPFTTKDRRTLIMRALQESMGYKSVLGWTDMPMDVDFYHEVWSRISFGTLRDYMYSDTKWASEVYTRVVSKESYLADDTTAIYGCMKDDSSYYLKMFPLWELKKQPYHHKWDASTIRDELYESRSIASTEMLQPSTVEWLSRWVKSEDAQYILDEYKYIREYQAQFDSLPFPYQGFTADSLVIKSGCILLIKRGFMPGKGQWALPGGWVGTNESSEHAAIRELKEETSIAVPKKYLQGSIKENKLFEHPNRSLRCRIVTNVLLMDLGSGPLPTVKGGDDAAGAFWKPIADVMKMEDYCFEDHFDIIFSMVSNY